MSEATGRPRLNLKPRDEAAAKKAEADRVAKLTHNPFGDAKPREAVLAARTGKTEEEVLKEAIKGERLRLRLTASQLSEKEALEALVDEVKGQLAAEGGRDPVLEGVLAERQAAVDALMDAFAHASLEAAQRGEIMRPSERRQAQQAQQALYGSGGGGGGGGGAGGGGYNDAPPPARGPGGGRGSFGDGGKGGFQERYMERGGSGNFGGGGSGRQQYGGDDVARGERAGYIPPPEGGSGRYNRDAGSGGEGGGAYREAPGAGGGRPGGGAGWRGPPGKGGSGGLTLPGMPGQQGDADNDVDYVSSTRQDRY